MVDAVGARRYGAFAFVAAGHLLIVLALVHPEGSAERHAPDPGPLLLLDLTRERPNAAPFIARRRAIPNPGGERAPATTHAPGSDVPSGESSESPAAEAPIDWYGEGEQVAGSQGAALLQELKRVCDEAALRGEHPPECRKYKKPDAWQPEPRKFGLAGGLPYVRLGKRCIAGLGFFGCGFGKLPEANSHLFDDMHEPDRPRSSAPDPRD